ncbi:MAG TPA: DUF2505 domain-containing protein [Kofleriaceae bacterium]|nr:DUF2505 domain-containing protein [Kofleriaceae bacterium]
MTTAFRFENTFRAPSVQLMLAAYFDPDHLAAQDALAKLGDRTVVEDHEDDHQRKTTWRVQSLEPLPLFVRPFVSGGRLRYLETMTWRKADDAIDLVVTPEILGGRVTIQALYQLASAGEGRVHRTYSGSVTVAVKLVSGKIERAILEKFQQSMPIMTGCTQTWLDKTYGA